MFEREILERRGGFNRAGGGNLGGAGTGNAAQWRIHRRVSCDRRNWERSRSCVIRYYSPKITPPPFLSNVIPSSFFFLFSNPIPRDRNTTFHPFSIISIEQDGISNSIVRRHSLHLIGINLSYKSPPIFLFVLNILSTCEGKNSVFFLLFFFFYYSSNMNFQSWSRGRREFRLFFFLERIVNK